MLTRVIKEDSMFFYDGDTLVLSMKEEEKNKDVCITLQGELRSDTTHHLQDELEAYVSVGSRIVLDFGGVTFVSASVLDALLDVQQLVDFFQKGAFILRNVTDEVYQAMDRRGLTDLLTIEE